MNTSFPEKNLGCGIALIELPAWKHFPELIHSLFTDTKAFIWRGQRNAEWELSSKLDRLLQDSGRKGADNTNLIWDHYYRFQFASRGRRGPNPLELKPDEWWALGQHYGLATPLLDWTASPFVAAYFAFYKIALEKFPPRAIFALHYPDVERLSNQIRQLDNNETNELVVVRPMSDDNPRLVNQAGLFTRVPIGSTIEEWIRKRFYEERNAKLLYKITVPDKDRDDCLRTLNRMNINHLTLFPDLYGAASHCNSHLEISKY